VGELEAWYREAKSVADFYVVYIREAHPTDGWQVQANVRQGVLVPTARSEEDRAQAASKCAKELKISIPVLIDNMNDEVERAYRGWPDRIYVVAKNGMIGFQGEPGPRGFRPLDAKAALSKMTAGP